MPDIKFNFRGKDFDANVPDSFLQRPKAEQQRLLLQNLKKKYDTKIPERGSDEKGILDYLALLERPSQALKVGFRESELGGDIYSALGGADLTPKEGIFKGIKSGWLGEDEVRTQDMLPDNLSPFTKGVLGFAGDVATDPLTWFAPGMVKGAGSLIKGAGEVTGATPVLKRAANKAMDAKFGKNDIGIPDLARLFNVPIGKSKEAKGVLDAGKDLRAGLQKEMVESIAPLSQYFSARARQLDVSEDEIKKVFTREAQRDRTTKEGFAYDPKLEAPSEAYILNDNSLTPLKPVSAQSKEMSVYTVVSEAQRDRTTKEGFAYDPKLEAPSEAYILNDNSLTPLKPVSAQSKEILGDEGLEMLDEWERIGGRLHELSVIYGQPLNRVVKKGYFPGVLTSDGRKYLEMGKDEFLEGIDDLGQPIFKAGYKKRKNSFR